MPFGRRIPPFVMERSPRRGALFYLRPGMPDPDLRPMICPPSRHAGFTLIELMLVVLLMAVLAAFAFPAFQSFIASTRLTAESNELLSGLNLARSEAVRLQRRVVLCRAAASDGVVTFAEGSGCITSDDGQPWQGWGVFVDQDTDGVLDADEDVVRVQAISGAALRITSDANLGAAGNRVVFRPDGLARGPGTLALQAGQIFVTDGTNESSLRCVTLASGSRMSVMKADVGRNPRQCEVPVAPEPEEEGT
jgi:type IV fimbrial biogenesis protein FimT